MTAPGWPTEWAARQWIATNHEPWLNSMIAPTTQADTISLRNAKELRQEHSMDKLRYAAAIAAAFTVGGTAQAAEWTVDKAMSSVGFVAEQQGSRFNGRFETFDATIDFDPGKPDAGKIMGTVVTDTVNTRDHDRDAALTDRDWFDSANFADPVAADCCALPWGISRCKSYWCLQVARFQNAKRW
jgi:hypothetical protein